MVVALYPFMPAQSHSHWLAGWARWALPARGLGEAGLPDGAVEDAQRGRELSDDELRLLLAFQGKLEEIIRDQLVRLRSPS